MLENDAAGDGGGIYTIFGNVTLNASHIKDRNTANLGGGIYSDNGTVTLNSDSSVTDNDAIANPPPPGGSGAAS